MCDRYFSMTSWTVQWLHLSNCLVLVGHTCIWDDEHVYVSSLDTYFVHCQKQETWSLCLKILVNVSVRGTVLITVGLWVWASLQADRQDCFFTLRRRTSCYSRWQWWWRGRGNAWKRHRSSVLHVPFSAAHHNCPFHIPFLSIWWQHYTEGHLSIYLSIGAIKKSPISYKIWGCWLAKFMSYLSVCLSVFIIIVLKCEVAHGSANCFRCMCCRCGCL